MSADCIDCKEKTRLLGISHDTISKIAARAETAERQLRAVVDLVPCTVGAHVEGFPCNGCAALGRLGIARTTNPFSDWAICGWCAGTGKEERTTTNCPKCNGAGGKYAKKQDIPVSNCAACHGAWPGHQPGCPFSFDQP